jgi:hypothetical protein
VLLALRQQAPLEQPESLVLLELRRLVRASLGRRGCLRRTGRERLLDAELASLRHFRRTEATRCCARA